MSDIPSHLAATAEEPERPQSNHLHTNQYDSTATTPRMSIVDHGTKEETAGDASVPTDSSNASDQTEKDIEKQAEAPAAAPPAQPQAPPKDPNLVVWDGPDDPENPMNWPRWKKWMVTMLTSTMTLTITFSSSVFSTATEVVAKEFNISDEVSILGTSLFVLGFAFGPLAWGPFSERFGRMPPLFAGFFLFAIFQIPVAVAVNVETIMLSRFLQGLFGCAPLAIVGGALADFWNPVDRAVAIAIFASATFIGPVAGPIVGGFVTQSHLGWRWTAWLTLIMAGTSGTIAFILVPETYALKILQKRATRRRHETKNWAIHSQLDESEFRVGDIVTRYILRPIRMLVEEPILALISIYMALCYGIIYLLFEAYPISFQEVRGWNLGVGALPFLGVTVGVLVGATIVSYLTKTRYARKLAKHGRVVPEERLPPIIMGGILLPIGLFWFAWTSSPHISWAPQVVAGGFIGCGIFMIFMQGFNYIIDVYLMFANSAIAANTLLRSLAGAGFPLFATAMYHTLGVDWATSLLGFICVAMVPIPILFFVYGKKVRNWSKFSPVKV